jgi:ribonuclease P protein component
VIIENSYQQLSNSYTHSYPQAKNADFKKLRKYQNYTHEKISPNVLKINATGDQQHKLSTHNVDIKKLDKQTQKQKKCAASKLSTFYQRGVYTHPTHEHTCRKSGCQEKRGFIFNYGFFLQKHSFPFVIRAQISYFCKNFGKISLGRINETHFSATQTKTQKYARFSRADVHQERPQSSCKPAQKRASQTDRQRREVAVPLLPSSRFYSSERKPQRVRNTLPKSSILRGYQTFQSVFDTGTAFNSSPVGCYVLIGSESEQSPIQWGFSISKKRVPLAADRNRLRRLMRETVRTNAHALAAALAGQKKSAKIVLLFRAASSKNIRRITFDEMMHCWNGLQHNILETLL